MKFNEQETDYLCSAGFVALGAARLFFKQVYDNLKGAIDEEASLRADYKHIKRINPAKAAQLRDEMARQYFTPEQRTRYKQMMQHIDLLQKDFEWCESFAMLEHLKIKLTPAEFCDIFDAYMSTSNDLARLILLWSDYCDNNKENGVLFNESHLKMHTPKERCGHLAKIFTML